MLRISILLLLLLLFVHSAMAQEGWGEMRKVMLAVPKPVVLEGEGVETKVIAGGQVMVKAPLGKPAKVRLVKIAAPLLSQTRYALQGDITYSDVGGEGYLEMWSDFGDKGRFFTRSLATHGPMAHIVGDSGKYSRKFSLPFDTEGKVPAPKELELIIVLPEGGYFSLLHGEVALAEFSPPQNSRSEEQPVVRVPFWQLGVFCALSVSLVCLLAYRAPEAARLLAWGGIATGVVALAAGIVAPFLGRPMAFCYPLLVVGVLITALYAALLWFVLRLRQKSELRRMVAMDLG